METNIRFFGALRKFADAKGFYAIELDEGVTVSKFKTALKSKLESQFYDFNPALIEQSAIANHLDILESSAVLNRSLPIAVLPPVCGG